jgi:hypothetical protein
MPEAVSAIAAVLSEQDSPGPEVAVADPRQVWAQISDPRDRLAAVVAGATGFAAIRHWIGAAPQQVLADAGARRSRWSGEYQAPHPDTVCRVLERVDPAEVDAAYARCRAVQLADSYDSGAAGAGDGELVAVRRGRQVSARHRRW